MKTEQLQIRLSPEEKRSIRLRAEESGMEISAWVLSRILDSDSSRFDRLVSTWVESEDPAPLAELNDFLTSLTRKRLVQAIEHRPTAHLTPFQGNYVAAMVETAALRREISLPSWTSAVRPLEKPYFGTTLQSLRLHLLTASPPAFRRRNIFIDSTLGDRK